MDYIDVRPSDEGYAQMRTLFRESVERHKAEIKTLEELQESKRIRRGVEALDHAINLFDEAIDGLLSARQASIQQLEESIGQIETYLRAKELTAKHVNG